MKNKIINFLKWYIQFKLNVTKQVLIWLSGKKGAIASIILTTTGYLGAKGIIGSLEVILIGSLSTIIFGTASYMTKKWIYPIKK